MYAQNFLGTNYEIQQQAEDAVEPGAAIRKMQYLAKLIYETTPGITQQMPQAQSIILANTKNEDEKGMKRAKAYLKEGSLNSTLKVHGNNKDLAIEYCAQDWPTNY